MCWTPPCTRPKTKTSKIKHTTQYVLGTTIQKTKDEDKKNHTTICVGHHHAQDKRRRQTNQKENTICVGHHHAQDKRRRQIKQKTQHNMCWTPPYTRQKTKNNKTNNTTQYVLDDTIHKTKH